MSEEFGSQLGGRGRCEYCHQMQTNVAYHSEWECPNRPHTNIAIQTVYYDALTGKSGSPQLLPIPSWDEFFLRHVYLSALKSKDPRTRIGAVLVRDKQIVSTGYNGFGRKVKDLPERYNDRETKYSFICHAEFNSILQCAKIGLSSDNTTLYTPGFPCAECCKAIIQGGISEIVIHKQWPNLIYAEKWVKSLEISKLMIAEAGISVRVFDGVLGMQGVLDGKIINI